jgi:sigma-B regulation protein RsbU (phosphoserine phosphatase)
MLLLVFGILVTTALVLMFFTERDLRQKILETEEHSVRNVNYLVKLNVEDQYGSLLFHKLSTLEKRKAEMKKLTALVVSNIERFQEQQKKGLLKEEEARLFALEWITTLRCDEESCFFVYDGQGTVLAHPDGALIGQNLSDLKDIKGVSLFRSMLEASRTRGDANAIFTWHCADPSKSSRKLGYFTYYPPLKWVIATAVNVEDIESDAQKRLAAIIKDLKQTFSNVKIAENGYLFLFNGKNELIIHPELPSEGLANSINLITGNLLLNDLKIAAQQTNQPIEFIFKGPSGEPLGPYVSYVQYFKTLDWYIASSTLKEELMVPVRKAVLRQISFIAVIFVISMFITFFLVRRISQPLKKLAAYARDLPKHDFSAPEASSEITGLPVKYRDEVGNLAEALLFMEESLRQYIINLRETTAAKERIESELKVASDIQMSILPRSFPAFPNRTEFDISATIKPAREVGGDFFDFFFIDDDHLFFTIGDVSGKGVPASLFMAITRTLLKAHASGNALPDKILYQVNNDIAENNDACVFVTVFCGILNITSGEVVYSNGGHNPPLIIVSQKTVEYITIPKGMALGVMEDAPYQVGTLRLQPGDVLFTYTDGVTEAMDPQGRLFSEKRLQAELLGLRNASIQEMSEGLMQRIMTFANGAQQSDDITMMLLKYHGSTQPGPHAAG